MHYIQIKEFNAAQSLKRLFFVSGKFPFGTFINNKFHPMKYFSTFINFNEQKMVHLEIKENVSITLSAAFKLNENKS